MIIGAENGAGEPSLNSIEGYLCGFGEGMNPSLFPSIMGKNSEVDMVLKM